MSKSFEFQVQYVDDVDPFNVLASIRHAEPSVPKKYTMVSDQPLFGQVPAMKKVVRAPHKVKQSHTHLYLVNLCIFCIKMVLYAE